MRALAGLALVGLAVPSGCAPPAPALPEVPPGPCACAGLEAVYFAPLTASLDRTARAVVGANAERLQHCPGETARVRGYVAPLGSEVPGAGSVRLSQARADTVRAAYVREGVPAERLVAEGLGDAPTTGTTRPPLPDEQARTGRRVETFVLSLLRRCAGKASGARG